jgi:hypothetical protein
MAQSKVTMSLGCTSRGPTCVLAVPEGPLPEGDEDQVGLPERYRRADDLLVRQFIGENRGVVPLLVEASAIIDICFGRSTPIDLQAEREASGRLSLFAVIRGAGEPDEVLANLHRFDEGWWLDRVALWEGANVVFTA